MNKGLRAVAMFTLASFLTTQCVSGAPAAGIEISGGRELPTYLSIDVPAELGTVDALYEAQGAANPQFILHIQNAHANYQAQIKIKQLLEYMNKKYGFQTIFVEGAAEKLNPDYLRLFPDQENNDKLCDELAKQGELTGAELFLMGQGKTGTAEGLGIEQVALYRSNYEALKKVFGAEADVNRFFAGFDSKLDRTASKTFNPETRQLIADWKRFEQGRREFMPFVRSLTAKAKKTLNVDLESLFAQVGWPQISRLLVIQQLENDMNKEQGLAEKAALLTKLRKQGVSKELLAALESFNEGSISVGKSAEAVAPRQIMERLAAEAGPKGFKFSDYPAFSLFAGYVILRSELDPKVLFEEIEYLFAQMLDTLALEPHQKALLALYRDGELLRKLLHLELSRTQWQQLLARKDSVAIPSLVSRLKTAVETADQKLQPSDGLKSQTSDLKTGGEAAVMPPKFAKTMNDLFDASLEFYDFAKKREGAFYQEIQTAMKARKITKAILITGGFHTDGMSDMFRENAVSYGIVTPRLSEKSNEKMYRSIMLGKNTGPFDLSYLEATARMQDAWVQFGQTGRVDMKMLGAYAAQMGMPVLADAVEAFKKTDAYALLKKGNPKEGIPGLVIVQEMAADGKPALDERGQPIFVLEPFLQAPEIQKAFISAAAVLKEGEALNDKDTGILQALHTAWETYNGSANKPDPNHHARSLSALEALILNGVTTETTVEHVRAASAAFKDAVNDLFAVRAATTVKVAPSEAPAAVVTAPVAEKVTEETPAIARAPERVTKIRRGAMVPLAVMMLGAMNAVADVTNKVVEAASAPLAQEPVEVVREWEFAKAATPVAPRALQATNIQANAGTSDQTGLSISAIRPVYEGGKTNLYLTLRVANFDGTNILVNGDLLYKRTLFDAGTTSPAARDLLVPPGEIATAMVRKSVFGNTGFLRFIEAKANSEARTPVLQVLKAIAMVGLLSVANTLQAAGGWVDLQVHPYGTIERKFSEEEKGTVGKIVNALVDNLLDEREGPSEGVYVAYIGDLVNVYKVYYGIYKDNGVPKVGRQEMVDLSETMLSGKETLSAALKRLKGTGPGSFSFDIHAVKRSPKDKIIATNVDGTTFEINLSGTLKSDGRVRLETKSGITIEDLKADAIENFGRFVSPVAPISRRQLLSPAGSNLWVPGPSITRNQVPGKAFAAFMRPNKARSDVRVQELVNTLRDELPSGSPLTFDIVLENGKPVLHLSDGEKIFRVVNPAAAHYDTVAKPAGQPGFLYVLGDDENGVRTTWAFNLLGLSDKNPATKLDDAALQATSPESYEAFARLGLLSSQSLVRKIYNANVSHDTRRSIADFFSGIWQRSLEMLATTKILAQNPAAILTSLRRSEARVLAGQDLINLLAALKDQQGNLPASSPNAIALSYDKQGQPVGLSYTYPSPDNAGFAIPVSINKLKGASFSQDGSLWVVHLAPWSFLKINRRTITRLPAKATDMEKKEIKVPAKAGTNEKARTEVVRVLRAKDQNVKPSVMEETAPGAWAALVAQPGVLPGFRARFQSPRKLDVLLATGEMALLVPASLFVYFVLAAIFSRPGVVRPEMFLTIKIAFFGVLVYNIAILFARAVMDIGRDIKRLFGKSPTVESSHDFMMDLGVGARGTIITAGAQKGKLDILNNVSSAGPGIRSGLPINPRGTPVRTLGVPPADSNSISTMALPENIPAFKVPVDYMTPDYIAAQAKSLVEKGITADSILLAASLKRIAPTMELDDETRMFLLANGIKQTDGAVVVSFLKAVGDEMKKQEGAIARSPDRAGIRAGVLPSYAGNEVSSYVNPTILGFDEKAGNIEYGFDRLIAAAGREDLRLFAETAMSKYLADENTKARPSLKLSEVKAAYFPPELPLSNEAFELFMALKNLQPEEMSRWYRPDLLAITELKPVYIAYGFAQAAKAVAPNPEVRVWAKGNPDLMRVIADAQAKYDADVTAKGQTLSLAYIKKNYFGSTVADRKFAREAFELFEGLALMHPDFMPEERVNRSDARAFKVEKIVAQLRQIRIDRDAGKPLAGIYKRLDAILAPLTTEQLTAVSDAYSAPDFITTALQEELAYRASVSVVAQKLFDIGNERQRTWVGDRLKDTHAIVGGLSAKKAAAVLAVYQGLLRAKEEEELTSGMFQPNANDATGTVEMILSGAARSEARGVIAGGLFFETKSYYPKNDVLTVSDPADPAVRFDISGKGFTQYLIAPNGKRVVAMGDDGALKVYDRAKGAEFKPVAELDFFSGFYPEEGSPGYHPTTSPYTTVHLALSPDSKMVAGEAYAADGSGQYVFFQSLQSGAAIQRVKTPKGRSFADPFFIDVQGQTYLGFVEILTDKLHLFTLDQAARGSFSAPAMVRQSFVAPDEGGAQLGNVQTAEGGVIAANDEISDTLVLWNTAKDLKSQGIGSMYKIERAWALAKNGSVVAAVTFAGVELFWPSKDGLFGRRTKGYPRGAANQVISLADGKGDGTGRISDNEDMAPAISENGNVIASISDKGNITILRRERPGKNYQVAQKISAGRDARLSGLVLSPDGNELKAFNDRKGKYETWDLRKTPRLSRSDARAFKVETIVAQLRQVRADRDALAPLADLGPIYARLAAIFAPLTTEQLTAVNNAYGVSDIVKRAMDDELTSREEGLKGTASAPESLLSTALPMSEVDSLVKKFTQETPSPMVRVDVIRRLPSGEWVPGQIVGRMNQSEQYPLDAERARNYPDHDARNYRMLTFFDIDTNQTTKGIVDSKSGRDAQEGAKFVAPSFLLGPRDTGYLQAQRSYEGLYYEEPELYRVTGITPIVRAPERVVEQNLGETLFDYAERLVGEQRRTGGVVVVERPLGITIRVIGVETAGQIVSQVKRLGLEKDRETAKKISDQAVVDAAAKALSGWAAHQQILAVRGNAGTLTPDRTFNYNFQLIREVYGDEVVLAALSVALAAPDKGAVKTRDFLETYKNRISAPERVVEQEIGDASLFDYAERLVGERGKDEVVVGKSAQGALIRVIGVETADQIVSQLKRLGLEKDRETAQKISDQAVVDAAAKALSGWAVHQQARQQSGNADTLTPDRTFNYNFQLIREVYGDEVVLAALSVALTAPEKGAVKTRDFLEAYKNRISVARSDARWAKSTKTIGMPTTWEQKITATVMTSANGSVTGFGFPTILADSKRFQLASNGVATWSLKGEPSDLAVMQTYPKDLTDVEKGDTVIFQNHNRLSRALLVRVITHGPQGDQSFTVRYDPLTYDSKLKDFRPADTGESIDGYRLANLMRAMEEDWQGKPYSEGELQVLPAAEGEAVVPTVATPTQTKSVATPTPVAQPVAVPQQAPQGQAPVINAEAANKAFTDLFGDAGWVDKFITPDVPAGMNAGIYKLSRPAFLRIYGEMASSGMSDAGIKQQMLSALRELKAQVRVGNDNANSSFTRLVDATKKARSDMRITEEVDVKSRYEAADAFLKNLPKDEQKTLMALADLSSVAFARMMGRMDKDMAREEKAVFHNLRPEMKVIFALTRGIASAETLPQMFTLLAQIAAMVNLKTAQGLLQQVQSMVVGAVVVSKGEKVAIEVIIHGIGDPVAFARSLKFLLLRYPNARLLFVDGMAGADAGALAKEAAAKATVLGLVQAWGLSINNEAIADQVDISIVSQVDQRTVSQLASSKGMTRGVPLVLAGSVDALGAVTGSRVVRLKYDRDNSHKNTAAYSALIEYAIAGELDNKVVAGMALGEDRKPEITNESLVGSLQNLEQVMAAFESIDAAA